MSEQNQPIGNQALIEEPPDSVAPGNPRLGGWQKSPALERLRHVFLDFGVIWALVLVVIIARVIYPGFLDIDNVKAIFSQNAPIGIIAVGMTMVMIAGGFDLSVGAIFAAGGVAFAQFSNHTPLLIAFLLALALGLLMGIVNGLLITKLKINAFVATLGTASIFSGLTFTYTHSNPVLSTAPSFDRLGLGETLGLANGTWVLIAVFVVGALVLARSVFGRALYAVGGNPEAARLAGMPVDWYRIGTYAIVGICSALGGAIVASRVQVAEASLGSTTALEAIAVVVIGGTSLFGGEGAMWRTAIGVLIVGCIVNLCNSQGVDVNTQSVIEGTIIIGAVALDAYSRRRRA